MKNTTKFLFGGLAIITALVVLAASPATASTRFVYEGLLWRDGQPFDGSAAIEFQLFDLPVAGRALAQPIIVDEAIVERGHFAAALDFDVNLLDGRPRWIEIRVDGDPVAARELVLANADNIVPTDADAPSDQGTGSAAFAASRHGRVSSFSSTASAGSLNHTDVTSEQFDDVPDSMHTAMEGSVPHVEGGVVGWQVSGSNIFFDGGKVGIGTDSPSYRLTVKHPNSVLFATATSGSGETFAVRGKVNSDDGYAGYFQGGRNYFQGSVGVGTASPQAKLDVRGSIRSGTNGQFWVPAATENLRFLRGRISSNGFVVNGDGFSAIRLAQGLFRVDFDTSFSSTPSVVATVVEQNEPRIATVYAVNNNLFEVRIWTPQGTDSNEDFHFIVTGPR